MKRAFKEIVQNAVNENFKQKQKQKEDEIRSSENQMVLQLFNMLSIYIHCVVFIMIYLMFRRKLTESANL
jgi:hypothetical protein